MSQKRRFHENAVRKGARPSRAAGRGHYKHSRIEYQRQHRVVLKADSLISQHLWQELEREMGRFVLWPGPESESISIFQIDKGENSYRKKIVCQGETRLREAWIWAYSVQFLRVLSQARVHTLSWYLFYASWYTFYIQIKDSDEILDSRFLTCSSQILVSSLLAVGIWASYLPVYIPGSSSTKCG